MVKTAENSQETKSLVSDMNKMFAKQKITLYDNLVQMVSVSKQIALEYQIDKKRYIEKEVWTRYGMAYLQLHENEYRQWPVLATWAKYVFEISKLNTH